MKRFISLIFFAISVLTSVAQVKSDASKHLSFKGVPIDGTLASYVSKMKAVGFTHKLTKGGMALLDGEFASYKNCHIGVSTLKAKDIVYKIAVIFPERETWSELSTNYYNLQELLTEKYGRPSETVEDFQSTVQPKDDSDRMYEVKFDRCNYFTTYETEKGTIQLSIGHDGVIRCYVKLLYVDKINGETVKKQALDDL
ncbi:MAG: hypothetical protein J0L80_07110 [Chitinophagales bacterium]|nr:hypothetical protein [Chitinophagales bacterium]